jgi:tetratricopeptide (TPR) repeat protein
VLHHERRYREDTVRAYHLPDPHPRRLNAVAAAATLYGADSEPSARRLLRSLPTFERQPIDVVDRYVRWARDLYPGPRVLNGLYPALLGEYDVAYALTEQPDIAFPPADDNQAVRALTVLGHAAVRHESPAAAIVTMLTGDPARLVPLGISVAPQLEDSGPFIQAMTEAVTGPASGDALDVALRHLPARTVALAGFARDVIGAALRSHLARPEPHPAVTAYLRSQLAVRLGDAGEDEKALAVSTESTTLYRQLVNEGQVALRPHLAIAVSNHAILLGRACRRRESLKAAESAVAIFRELADDRADKYEPYLAKALDNLSICLASADRNVEAFETNARAVEIYQRRSGSVTPVHLASALSNQAVLLRRAGRGAEAQESGTAAATTFARLAAGQPDAFLRPFAISLDGDILAALLRQASIATEDVTAEEVRRLAATITTSAPVREEFIDAVIRGCVPVWDDPTASPPDELAMRWGSWHIDLGQEPVRQALLEAIAATALVSAGIVDVDVGWTACVLPAVITAIEPADLGRDGPVALALVLRDQARTGETDLYAGLSAQVRDTVNAQDFAEFVDVLRARAGAGGQLTLALWSQVTLKPGEAQE